MLIKQLLNDSEVITKRPDARTRALLSINTVLADVCNNADYPNDLVETVIANPTPGSYTASIPLILPDLPARRKIEYVIAGGKKLTAIKPRAALSTSGCVWKDAYYRSGNDLQINCSVPFDQINFGYYAQTGILAETDEHWLLDEAPLMILAGVCAAVFRATGDETSGNEYEAQYRLLRKQFRGMLVDTEDL